MEFENVIVEKDASIAVLTLNRPQQLNGLSYDLVKDLSLAMQELDHDDEVRVMIVTGGEKVLRPAPTSKKWLSEAPSMQESRSDWPIAIESTESLSP